ncbi:MAG: DEAD/DEAH box helicase family protein, partial [Cyanothece sp. SIO2G6]|nr:DEAD/DEAH box helicase family protein [Cyanothece sp. SIO2G6]
MAQNSNSWNPEIPGQTVRLKANPGLQGQTTGKVRKAGSRTLVEVQFGPAEKSYKPKNLLELCDNEESIESLIRQGRYGGPDDLRRILTFEKLKGKLTNIFYSMETSQTDFYAHQFKPILKFVNSSVGRILIADEVGLGKTIEAIYIWKELQVREDAQRLLIVCPAMLREKWRDDLRERFNIFADIVDAKSLLQHVRLYLERPRNYSFVCITSLEGIRPGRNWDDQNIENPCAQLARLLDSHPASQDQSVFNLAIIDEAHYLRNATTASHRIGQLIRDASQYLLLLTATPVQVNSSNLYQLLRLISPEDFLSEDLFNQMLAANQPIIEALRYLWSTPANFANAKQCVEQAKRSPFFADNRLLDQIANALTQEIKESDDQRIELGFRLEKVSLLSQYITRSRKRDVLPNRVERKPQTLQVHFSPLEKQIYDTVTNKIRQQLKGKRGASLFQLIARQRQMASCMVAALETWKHDRILDQFIDESSWEDFGVLAHETKTKPSAPAGLYPTLSDADLEELKRQDSKYQQLRTFLQAEIKKNSQEKFVIFAYFRGTLQYLEDRLHQDQISNCLIMGDMGDRKWDIVQQFRQPNGPSVLLSSEVGSEGIDLQHCRFLVNYDLPWNPMRVEQRIGRLDRLGQKAKSIAIINFSLVDTIEERILERLYDRIQIFEESIGDLESILGDMTEQLLVEFFNPELSLAEREKWAIQRGDALKKQRLLQKELENEAVNMMAFSGHILDSINQSHDEGRWLQPREINSFIEDYFARYYPGTIITQPSNSSSGLYQITL